MDKDSNTTNISVTPASQSSDMETPFESCLIEDSPDPCAIVIVGASGDLTARKVVPAIFKLFIN